MSTPSNSLPNRVKERIAADEVALGMIVRLARSGDVARIAKTSGHDFIFMDGQHSLYSVETIGHIAQTALAIGITPMVRVRGCDDPDIGMLLDNGVMGIVFPDIDTPEKARRAVAAAKFPPVGKRSVAGGYPMFDFRPVPPGEAVSILNQSTVIACMIESPEGLANVEEIAKIDGIDVLHVGSGDLLVAMGKPGKFGDPEHIAAVERVIAAAKANGKTAGLGGERDALRQADFIRKGVRFVTTQSDAGFLQIEASRRTKELRGSLEGATR